MQDRIKLLIILALSLFAFPVFAQETAEVAAAGTDLIGKGLAVIGAGAAAMGAGIGIGNIAGRLLEAISRQPELEGKLTGHFFLTVGLTDAVPIIAIALSMIVLFG